VSLDGTLSVAVPSKFGGRAARFASGSCAPDAKPRGWHGSEKHLLCVPRSQGGLRTATARHVYRFPRSVARARRALLATRRPHTTLSRFAVDASEWPYRVVIVPKSCCSLSQVFDHASTDVLAFGFMSPLLRLLRDNWHASVLGPDFSRLVENAFGYLWTVRSNFN